MKKLIFSLIGLFVILNFIFKYPFLSVFNFSFYFILFSLHLLIFYSFSEKILKKNSIFLKFSISFFIYSNILFLLCLFKLLKKEVFLMLSFLFLIFSLKNFLRNLKRIYLFLVKFNFKEYWILIFPLFIILIKIFMPVLDYDALSYHLNLPHLYIMSNGFSDFSGFLFFSFPQFVEMIYTGILLLFPPWTTQILSFIFFLFSVILVNEIYREFFGERDKFLTLILFSTPCLIFYSATSYVDIVLMYYVLFSFYLYLKGEFFLSSFFAGVCFSIKYTGITAILGIGLLFLFFNRKKILNILYSFIPFIPYFFKNLYYVKNPVYPFFSNDYLHYFKHVSSHGIGLGFKTILLPYYLTYEGIRFGLGFDFIGIVYLILFIVFLFYFYSDLRNKKFSILEKKIFLFLLPATLAWIFKSQVLRFIIPFIPFYLIIFLKYRKKIYSSILYLGIFYNIIFSFYVFSNTGGFEFLNKNRRDFLMEKHPSFKGFEYLNKIKGKINLLFLGETRGFYLKKKFFPVSIFDKHPLLEMFNENVEEVVKELRAKFTHIFISKFELKRLGEKFSSSNFNRQKKEKLIELLSKFEKIYEDENTVIYRI